MTAFEITERNSFMSKLLRTSLFDHFLLVEAAVHTSVTYQIDGLLHGDFFPEEELSRHNLKDCSYIPFSFVRETIFSMIRGKYAPLSFRFVFTLSPENIAGTLAQSRSGLSPEDITGMFLNLNFKNGKLTATTGISYRTFTLEKTLDREWDVLAEKFFQKNQIPVKTIL